MIPVLHRPQPLPLVRLRFGAVMVVVVLHLALLWMANLNWPVSTVVPGAAHNTRQGIGGQIFTKTGNSLSAGSHPGYQVITSAGHQRFGRAESMLLLADARVNRNPPPVKGAGVTTLSKVNADAPLNLSLTPFYLGRLPTALPERSLTGLSISRQRHKPHEAFVASSKAANDFDCFKKNTETPAQGWGVIGPLLKRAIEEKCQNPS